VPEIDETFLYVVFTTMTGARKASTIEKLGEALNDYEDLRPAGTRFDYYYVPQMLLYAARAYLIASKNHVVLNLVKRIERAFMRFFCALRQKFTSKNWYKVWRYVRGRMAREVGPSTEDAMWVDVSEVPTSAPTSIETSTSTRTSRSTPPAPTPPTWWRSGGGPTCAGCTICR
jgi:hypothetical protein